MVSLTFGSVSQAHLAGVTPALRGICVRALELGSSIGFDFSVIDGLRTPAEAKANTAKGTSQTTHSKHLPSPPDGLARAVDLCPYPKVQNGLQVDMAGWATQPEVLGRWWTLRALMMLAAAEQGLTLRWGGDWDSDLDMRDHTMLDAFHFELV